MRLGLTWSSIMECAKTSKLKNIRFIATLALMCTQHPKWLNLHIAYRLCCSFFDALLIWFAVNRFTFFFLWPSGVMFVCNGNETKIKKSISRSRKFPIFTFAYENISKILMNENNSGCTKTVVAILGEKMALHSVLDGIKMFKKSKIVKNSKISW